MGTGHLETGIRGFHATRSGLEGNKRHPRPLPSLRPLPPPVPRQAYLNPPYLYPRAGDVERTFDLGIQFGHGDEPRGEAVWQQGLRSGERPGIQLLLSAQP